MKKYFKQNVYYFKNVNEQYLHICGINLSINASQIVWIALKDHKKLFYCFFYLFGPNHKVQLVLYLSSKLRESFPYFSQRSLSYLFLLKEVHDKNTKTTILHWNWEKKNWLTIFFWPGVNLFHVVINLCWFFLCQLFFKELNEKKGTGEFFFNFVWCKTEKAKDFAHIFPQSCRK